MSTQPCQFTAFSRLLHWTMAAMVLTMLCIGVAMVGAILFHTLIVRDGILKRMAPWNIRPQQAAATEKNGMQVGRDNEL